MAKIARKYAKIFGETATSTGTDPQIGQFGSAKAGTYTGTGDVETIQSLTAWSNGWIDAVTATQQFPTLPEMTGVHKVLSYQNAYVLQQGKNIEWDANTTYYKGSDCCVINGTTVTHYTSLTDDNINNNPTTDTTNWKSDVLVSESYTSGSSGYIIYSNNLCVQWGAYSGTIGGYGEHDVTLLKTYKDTNYIVKVTGSPADFIVGASVSTTNVFKHRARYFDDDLGGTTTNAIVYWTTIGYLA